MTGRIKAARVARGWSQARLVSELSRMAARQGKHLPDPATVKSRVSRWENGHSKPDDFYRQLLREAFGMDDRELGFEWPSPVLPTSAEDLQVRLTLGKQVDGDLIAALQAQTEAIRVQDRQFGAGLCSSSCAAMCGTSRGIWAMPSSTRCADRSR